MRNNNKLKALVVALVLLAFSSAANAQIKHGIYLNLSVPTGAFAEDVNAVPFGRTNMGKDAVFGFGGTYRIGFDFDIIMGHICPFAEASLNWNRISGDNRDKFAEADGSAPSYINVPLMVGVNYQLPVSLIMIIHPYVEFGMGTDLYFTSGEKFGGFSYGDSKTKDIKINYLPNFAFAWQIGAGVNIAENFSVGLTYMGYGSHKIKYTNGSSSDGSIVDEVNGESASKTVNRNMGTLLFRFGFHF